jgi:hypothetical protein
MARPVQQHMQLQQQQVQLQQQQVQLQQQRMPPQQQAQGLFGSSSQQSMQRPGASNPFSSGPASHYAPSSIYSSIIPGSHIDIDEEAEFVEAPTPGPIKEPATVVKESPLSLTYSVEGKTSVPSDGLAHQVSVASLPFESIASYVAVPRAETVAYLEVSVSLMHYPAWSWSTDVHVSAP